LIFQGSFAARYARISPIQIKLPSRIALASPEPIMPDVVTATTAQPAPRHAAIRVLLRAGRNDEAIVQLCAITITEPDDLDAEELLFDAFFQKRQRRPALVLAEELAPRDPRSHFGGGHQNLAAVLEEVEHLGIPRML
jgi:hypothetical protein